MICEPCAAAADLVPRANSAVNGIELRALGTEYVKLIVGWHGVCAARGSTWCDCQHKARFSPIMQRALNGGA